MQTLFNAGRYKETSEDDQCVLGNKGPTYRVKALRRISQQV